MAYFAIEPFAAERDDWRMGDIWSAMVNLWTKKSSKSMTAKDFVERMRRRFDPQPVKALNRKIKGVLKRFGDG